MKTQEVTARRAANKLFDNMMMFLISNEQNEVQSSKGSRDEKKWRVIKFVRSSTYEY